MTCEEVQKNLLVIDSGDRRQDTEISEHLSFSLIHLQL